MINGWRDGRSVKLYKLTDGSLDEQTLGWTDYQMCSYGDKTMALFC